MEKKPFKIKYGRIGFLYVYIYFLIHSFYPDWYKIANSIHPMTDKSAIALTIVALAPLGIFCLLDE